jgi:hypothetical protein
MTAEDLTGRRFGRLLVLGPAPRPAHATDTRGNRHFWACRCDCGNLHVVCDRNLRGDPTRRPTRSCGCLRRELAADLGRRDTRFLDWQGQRRSLLEWAALTGISPVQIHGRLRAGWPVERALSAPVRTWTRRR